MGAHRYRLPLALAAAVVAAGAATFLLRPRSGVIEPATVDPTAYFSAEQLERARDFRGPQRIIGMGILLLEGGVLVLLAVRPPPVARRLLERAGRRPLRGAALTGASLTLVLVAVALPLEAVQRSRSVDVGLTTQSFGGWLGDVAKSSAIGALLAAGAAALAVALVRRFPRGWWLPGAASLVALSAVFVYVSPVVLEPLFNRFTALPEGRLRGEVLELARKAEVKVGEVYRVDASRRTTGANAYVGGLGGTKRVVLYDNLIEDFPAGEVRSVVAHELAHVRHRDVLRGLAWLAVVAPFGTLLIQRLTEGVVRRQSARSSHGLHFASRSARPPPPLPGTPAILPALALSLALVSFAAAVFGNVLSRRVEARADAFALDLTGQPAAFVALERRLAVQNISDPDPPALFHDLFGTHPTPVERIGAGLAWARAE